MAEEGGIVVMDLKQHGNAKPDPETCVAIASDTLRAIHASSAVSTERN
ncbi:hypothetical protein [Salinisphaera sp. Q1T1-3]|nr:hypothetical protein [Salinisphaera sp. Q1T1-3]